MRLVITEKPSVARDLARVLGVSSRHNGYIEGAGLRITWCIGHLLQLQDPAHYRPEWKSWRLHELPMVPESFDLKVRDSGGDQWKVVKRLLGASDVEDVVNACDAGREGELIFRYAYQHARCKRPVLRFWASSLTDSAVRKAWSQLRPGERFDPLADAARCRSESDWLVGLNATRAMTCRTREQGAGTVWSVGRVQTPTLAMIVGRDAEIEAFVPETYWRVEATFRAGTSTWKAKWFRDAAPSKSEKSGDDEVPAAQRLPTEAAAAALVAAVTEQTGTVVKADRRRRVEKPPLLYDLTSLQRRANQRFSYPAKQTLDIAQALYETHKLLTYPRTDARYLTTDQVAGLPDIVRGISPVPPYAPFCQQLLAGPIAPGKRVVDDSEVGDHHAIIPTGRSPVGMRLTVQEKRVFDLVARRFLAVLSDDALFDVTDLVVAVPPLPSAALPDDVPVPLTFRARGSVCRQEGWRAVDPPKKRAEVDLPPVEIGDEAEVAEAAAREGTTRPPRPHDDASLLRTMETAGRALDEPELKRALRSGGLGTPATRAAILETLESRKYVVREGKTIRATAKGKALITVLPVDELKSAELTGRWEARLAAMAEGNDDRPSFMADVVSHLHTVITAMTEAVLPDLELEDVRPATPELGTCPSCGKPVRKRGPVWTCDTGRDCPFVVFSSMAKRRISERMVKTLLEEGKTPIMKGFKSKKGKPFEAGLCLKDDGGVGFWFDDSEPPPPSPPSDPVGLRCPSCGRGSILAGRAAWGCGRWREGCTFRLPFVHGEQRISPEEAVRQILAAGRSA